eukprot:SAG11_NODE_38281_length_253_cov_0.649351_1_plen_27_part_01
MQTHNWASAGLMSTNLGVQAHNWAPAG